MEDDWFTGWSEHHRYAVGAPPDADALFFAERETFLSAWGASPAELGECTARLTLRDAPPSARECVDAVGRELLRIREERRTGSLPPPAAAPGDFAPDCGACSGSGLATVPHPSCLWDRRLVLPRGYAVVLTAAVLCDRCGVGRLACERERARKDGDCRPTLTAYDRRHGVDSVALLRQWERDQAKAARRSGPGLPHGAGDWSRMIASLLAKVREAANSAA